MIFSLIYYEALISAVGQPDFQWAWLSGDANSDQSGVYGTINQPNSNNKIGARYNHAMDIDEVNRVLYVSAGYGNAQSSGGKDLTDSSSDFRITSD